MPEVFVSGIAFNAGTRMFTIKPFDPLVDGFIPRFLFYSWSTEAILHRIFEPLEIEIPNEKDFSVFILIRNQDREETRSLHLQKIQAMHS